MEEAAAYVAGTRTGRPKKANKDNTNRKLLTFGPKQTTGADPNQATPDNGRFPLWTAMHCTDVVHALLVGGADPCRGSTDRFRTTALYRASCDEHVESAQLLLAAGVCFLFGPFLLVKFLAHSH